MELAARSLTLPPGLRHSALPRIWMPGRCAESLSRRSSGVLPMDEVLAALGSERFDVSPATEGENRAAGAYRVSKNGCAAEIAPSVQPGSPVRLLAKGGWVLGGEIARLLDRGYQKFLQTTKLEIPATADFVMLVPAAGDVTPSTMS
jgi:hypothetical protein